MKFFPIICFVLASFAYGQDLKIAPKGQKLKDTYLAMNVENLWIAGTHIDWETGLADEPGATHGIRTHCSAFVAAACEKLGIYVLRPPQHGQVLLANAQEKWLNSADAVAAGWVKINIDSNAYEKIQKLANEGKVVVAVSRNPDPKKPGHAALVMPTDCSEALLNAEGPEMIMAGEHNHNQIPLIKAFKSHIHTWPSQEVEFFMHELP